jgi:hypothetical protein
MGQRSYRMAGLAAALLGAFIIGRGSSTQEAGAAGSGAPYYHRLVRTFDFHPNSVHCLPPLPGPSQEGDCRLDRVQVPKPVSVDYAVTPLAGGRTTYSGSSNGVGYGDTAIGVQYATPLQIWWQNGWLELHLSLMLADRKSEQPLHIRYEAMYWGP